VQVRQTRAVEKGRAVNCSLLETMGACFTGMAGPSLRS
jgi:hypothetical protein